MLPEPAIIKLIQKHVATLTDLPIKYINTNMKPPKNGKWWEIIFIPNNLDGEFWSKGQTYRGFFRFLLHWPQINDGIYKPYSEVEKLVDGFEKGSVFEDLENNVKVILTENPKTNTVLEEPPELLISLTIRYNCFIV